MLDALPEDVQRRLLKCMPQASVASLAGTCRVLRELAVPLLARHFRCVSCRAHLFHPRELALGCAAPGSDRNVGPRKVVFPGPCTGLPRRCFYELRSREHGVVHDGSMQDVKVLGMSVDKRRGAANFHVLRHLAQTMFQKERFPLAQELSAVRALRCDCCGVFVGFRKSVNGQEGVVHHDFVHHDFVELIDGDGNCVSLTGDVLFQNDGGEESQAVQCATPSCGQVLFDREDVLPWSHVLSSSRLTDLDAYLEWDHSWAGAATASQPAFFVKRLRKGASRIGRVRAENLRQGTMEVGDVRCSKCKNHVGWKFMAELPEHGSDLLQNYDQVGRYGIIRTAVALYRPRGPE